MLADVGVRAKVSVLEPSQRIQLLRSNTFPGLLLADPASTTYDTDGVLWRLRGPGGIVEKIWPGGNEGTRFYQLMEEARSSLDAEKRLVVRRAGFAGNVLMKVLVKSPAGPELATVRPLAYPRAGTNGSKGSVETAAADVACVTPASPAPMSNCIAQIHRRRVPIRSTTGDHSGFTTHGR